MQLSAESSRLLFCWELGANFGHLANIAALQSQLHSARVETSFAVSDLRAARAVLGSGARLYQAPSWGAYTHTGSRVLTASFADVLTLVGFADASYLAPVVDAWMSLISAVRPGLIIADHSPAAQLAARLARIPIITMGGGFTMPPLDYPTFPPLRMDIAPAVPESQLLRVVNGVLEARGLTSPFATLPEAFRSDARLVVGLPELDPYRSFRREPLTTPPGGFAEPVLPDKRRLFIYFGKEMPGLAAKIQAICDLPLSADIYIRGGDSALQEFIRLRGKTALSEPGDARQLLQRASHVVSQGGAMLASEALAAGRPHFFVPLHNETVMNAAAVARQGYGREYPIASTDPQQFRRELAAFLSDDELSSRTLNFAKILAQRPLPDAGEELLRLIPTLMASSLGAMSGASVV